MQDIESRIAEKVAKQSAEDAAGRTAAALALPGPLVDIFAPQPEIQVGKYSVRAFYDADFEFLQLLGHPFAAFAVGQTGELETFVPRGPIAWQLFWLMTRPVTEAEAAFQDKAKGVDWIKADARREFGNYQLGALFTLYKAVVKQLTIYASSVVGYGAADTGEAKDGEEAASSQRPPSGEQPTASAGS